MTISSADIRTSMGQLGDAVTHRIRQEVTFIHELSTALQRIAGRLGAAVDDAATAGVLNAGEAQALQAELTRLAVQLNRADPLGTDAQKRTAIADLVNVANGRAAAVGGWKSPKRKSTRRKRKH